jgi:hypothetical protein
MAREKKIPTEALLELKKRLEILSPRSPDRLRTIEQCAIDFGVTTSTVYRQLGRIVTLRQTSRADKGKSRTLPKEDLYAFCDVIAALKVRTKNKKGRRMSTRTAIHLLETAGVETPSGLLRSPPGHLKRQTVDRYLTSLRLDARTLDLEPAATRFQATHSNECWQFDLSPSDLKQIGGKPDWIDEAAISGRSSLMLYSVVDDRSGVAYQEYHLVQGEDVLAALRFFFRACAPKNVPVGDFPFQGIPKMLYTDNGPIAKSNLFKQVMAFLGVEMRTHTPQKDKTRKTSARAKGKVERPFRTVKEVHETLYHFHKPESLEEANKWLVPYLLRYNADVHRSGNGSRLEDWIQNLPAEGLQPMCSWERYTELVREPVTRTVGIDATISLDGVFYRVDSELQKCEVTVWHGPLDNSIFVEWRGRKYGPFAPAGDPIALHRYRAYKKTALERKIEEIEELARSISVPKSALDSPSLPLPQKEQPRIAPPITPDPFSQLTFANPLDARRFLAKTLGKPLGLLPPEQLAEIDKVLSTTLDKSRIVDALKALLERRSC